MGALTVLHDAWTRHPTPGTIPPMPSNHGIPIGTIQVRSVRNQHGQRVVNIPKEFCSALGITPGDYVEFCRFTDGSLRIRRFSGLTPATHVPLPTARSNSG